MTRRNLRLLKANASAAPLTDLDFFLLGAISKLFATGITYPCALHWYPHAVLRPLTSPSVADLTVKARMQAGAVEGRSYNSSLDGLQKILKNEGFKGLYKGVGPKLTQSVATVRSPTFW